MDIRSKQNAVALSEDTKDLLDHIAWTEGIKPRIDDLSRRYSEILVEAALGAQIAVNGKRLTTEQIAGRLYGIKWIADLFTEILRRGEKALVDLEHEAFAISR